MTPGMWFELGIAALSLIIVGITAWAEGSLGTFSRVTIRELLDERLHRGQESELEETQLLRADLLLIEMLLVGVSTALITHVLFSQDIEYGLLIGLAAGTVAHVLFGRVLPRALIRPTSNESNIAKIIGRGVRAVFQPLVWPVNAMTGLVGSIGGAREAVGPPDMLTGEYPNETDADEAAQDLGEIEDDEHEMLSNVLALVTASAHDIMVPRLDVVAIPKTASIAEAVDVAIQAGHSRIPVFDDSIDEIVGILYAKDLLQYVTTEHEGLSIMSLLRDAHFVPESKRLDDLLQELQQAKIHMAIVVDEYGGTAGVVTIEDILEEIVGEIEDEFDKEVPLVEVISDDEIVIDGRLLVEDCVDQFDLLWEPRPSGTVSGLIQRELGRIPKSGDVIQIDGLRFTVESVERRRVRQVRCERISEEIPARDEQNATVRSSK